MHFQGIDSACAPNAPSRFVLSGTERQYERARPFQLRHQTLDITLLVESRSIDARATLDFVRVDPSATVLELDAVAFAVESVKWLDGDVTRDATHTYDGNRISIEVPLEMTEGCIEIDYQATPRRGLYFLAPDAEVPERPHQVWSQCQDEDARHWFPCHDAPHMKLTSEVMVTVPIDWVALSNGTCVDTEIGCEDGTASMYHFRLDRPHPSYLVTLVAGQFSILEDRAAELPSGKQVPIRYYVPVGREADAWRSLADTPSMVELFSRVTGLEYPFDSYSQVVVADFVFGGMENTTATTLYEHVLLDERAAIDVDSRSLVAHELAHQWFGDTLTCRNWHEAWLNEGFATYFEHVERESRLGRHEYDWSILRDLDSYLDEFTQSYDRPIVCREYQAPIDLFDRHLYEKGSLVLHMLRRRLGDSVFWSCIREYVKQHENHVVETGQLVRVCEQISGQALDRFFDDWVYRSGHPELTVTASYEAGRLEVTIRQEPKAGRTDPFHITLDLRVQTADGHWVAVTREARTATEVVVLSLEKRPLAIAFDPDLRIAAPIKLDLGFDWLKNLLLANVSLRSRLLAVTALGLRQDEPSLRLLRDVLCDDNQPYPLGIECARALGKTRAPETVTHLIAAIGARRAEVRRAVASALGQFRVPAVVAPLTALADDASYLVSAEACRSLGRSRQPEARALLLSKLRLSSWADALRSGVIDGLAALRQPDLIPTLLEEARYGTPSRGRRAAVLALGRLATDRLTRESLELLLDDRDPHLRSDVVDALVNLGQEQALGSLSAHLEREGDTRVQRRLKEALRDLGARDTGSLKRLNDDFVAMKGKLSELETQVSRLIPTDPRPAEGTTERDAATSKRAGRPSKTAPVKTKIAKTKIAKTKAPAAARGRDAAARTRPVKAKSQPAARKGRASKSKAKSRSTRTK